MAGIPDWPSQPDEIWGLILEKLQLEDFVRCRSICSSWYSIIGNLKQCSSESRVPWLMLPPKGLNYASEPMRFLDMASGKMHGIHLPVLERVQILGSSEGWIIGVEYKTDDLKLFNPFSKAQIQLPPIPGKPWMYKVYLSITSNCRYTVVAHHFHGALFLRSGDKAWTDLQFPERRSGNWNGTFYKGLFCVLDNQGRVVSFDLRRPGGGSDPCPLSVKVPPPPPSPQRHTLKKIPMDSLVVLPDSEELFLVRVYSSKIVKAFRLDQKNAAKMRKFGGYSLFVAHGDCGPSYKIIDLTQTKGSVREKCVYIAEEKDMLLDVFDMEVQSSTQLNRWKDCWGTLVWVSPVMVNLN